jgi:uncharacterized membrane protein YphA (DoxX/SURF4 family)
MTSAAFVARFVIGGVFVFAGAAKLRRRPQFERAVRTFEIGGDRRIRFVAAFVPTAELVSGAFLLLGLATRAAAILVAGLLVAFITASARQLLRGRAVDCGCFGSIGMHPLSWFGVVRNLGFLGMALLIFDEPITAIGLDQVVGNHRPILTAIDALALVEVAAVVVLASAIGRQAVRLPKLVAQSEQRELLAR